MANFRISSIDSKFIAASSANVSNVDSVPERSPYKIRW
jgi:hypothetical protein